MGLVNGLGAMEAPSRISGVAGCPLMRCRPMPGSVDEGKLEILDPHGLGDQGRDSSTSCQSLRRPLFWKPDVRLLPTAT